MSLVMLGFNALSFKIWEQGGRHDLVAQKNVIHGWGVSQLQRAYDKAKMPPCVKVGTSRPLTPTPSPSSGNRWLTEFPFGESKHI